MGKKEAKTNAIRILETMKIPYEARTYECDDFVDAAQIADKLGLDHAGMYKTITTVGKSGGETGTSAKPTFYPQSER